MFKLILHLIRRSLRTRESLILENVALRHQLQVLSRGRRRPALKNRDRMVWILLRRVWQRWRKPLVIVQPETVNRRHRRGVRAFWRRKRRHRSEARPRFSRHDRPNVSLLYQFYPCRFARPSGFATRQLTALQRPLPEEVGRVSIVIATTCELVTDGRRSR